MSKKQTSTVLAGMERARRRLEGWRARRVAGTALPQTLWAMAVQLAQRHGVYPTSLALGLEYNKLKRLSQGNGEATKPGRSRPQPTFVELMAPLPGAEAACRIELEGQAGARLKIEVPLNASAALLSELCQMVCGSPR